MRPIVPVIIEANGRKRPTYAMFDTGATMCALARSMVQELGIKVVVRNMTLGTFDKISHGEREMVSYRIHDINEKLVFEINDSLVGSFMTTEKEKPPTNACIEKFGFMADVNLVELEDDAVELLLPNEFSRYFFGKEVRVGTKEEPIAVLTDFGWTVIGQLNDVEEDGDVYSDEEVRVDALIDVSDVSIDQMIRLMYRMDFIRRPEDDYPAEIKHMSQFDE